MEKQEFQKKLRDELTVRSSTHKGAEPHLVSNGVFFVVQSQARQTSAPALPPEQSAIKAKKSHQVCSIFQILSFLLRFHLIKRIPFYDP